jgi:5-methylcytosine-specific restriction endonuclease McrA
LNKCVQCGDAVTYSQTATYCSGKCRSRASRRRNKKTYSIACAVCSVVFTSDRPKKYCGRKCGHRADYLKNGRVYTERMYEKYRLNPEPELARQKRRYRRNPEKYRLLKLRIEQRRRAKLLGVFVEDITPEDFRAICNRQNDCCWWCGRSARLTMDHVVPVSRGGKHEKNNIIGACQSCNSAKRDKLWDLSSGALYRRATDVMNVVQEETRVEIHQL